MKKLFFAACAAALLLTGCTGKLVGSSANEQESDSIVVETPAITKWNVTLYDILYIEGECTTDEWPTVEVTDSEKMVELAEYVEMGQMNDAAMVRKYEVVDGVANVEICTGNRGGGMDEFAPELMEYIIAQLDK